VEAIGDKGVLGRFEKLLNLSAREFPPKSGFFLWVEVSFLPIASCLGYQLDMPVMQRSEQLAENIEELIITGLPRDFWSVGPKLFFPVDIPQFEKWIPVVEGLPQHFEVLFRVTNDHGSVDLSTSAGGRAHGCRVGSCMIASFGQHWSLSGHASQSSSLAFLSMPQRSRTRRRCNGNKPH
jgi:hypothetical protein